MEKIWKIYEPDPDAVRAIGHATGLCPISSAVLANRGFATPDEARDFLNAGFGTLRPPLSLKGMKEGVERIARALLNSEKILIFGDYDADGTTATAILHQFLSYAGASVSYYIPERHTEGYGFKKHHITNHARPREIDLIITVDCGADSHDAVTAAAEAGIDVIITDHHTMGETLPPAVAVINPKRRDCTSGLEHLAGVGVAFYLIIALRTSLRERRFWEKLPEPNLKNYCDLVALGTVADVVPLEAENRALTKAGIDVINRSPRMGLKALIHAGKIKKDAIDSGDIAFKLAPRINAAGRMAHASQVVELFLTGDAAGAKKIADTLNKLNFDRQAIEKTMVDEITEYIEKTPALLNAPALILAREGWHRGVLGIVASRLVNNYFKPAVLISLDGDTGSGSGRSIPGVNLYDALLTGANELETFGGHQMAAGLRIRKDKIQSFREAFISYVNANTSPEDFQEIVHADANLDMDDISDRLIDNLEAMQPFGTGISEPLFMAEDVSVVSSRIVGTAHRRMILTQKNGRSDKTVLAIQFNAEVTPHMPDHFSKVLFRLQWNRWNNGKSPQMVIEDIVPA